ncbi:MAG: hypothetical protein ACLFVJ_12605 [Persicimonas sp.]
MKRFLSLCACLVLTAGLTACGGGENGGGNNTSGPACETHDDCSGEERCSAEGSCFGPGDSCEADANCPNGEAYCSVDDRTSAEGQCLGNWCDGDEDCPGHAVCNTETNTCRTGCRADDDCSGDWICDSITLQCEDPSECEEDSDCSAHKQCNTDGDVNVCEYDGTCERQVHCTSYANQLDDGEEYFCNDEDLCEPVPPCESDDECEIGEICVEGDCRGGCRGDDDCLLGEYCDMDTLRCTDGCNTDSDCENEGDVCVDLQCEAGCPDGRDQCEPGLICTGDPAYCQPCDDDNQCYGAEFCDIDATDSEDTGWCKELPPECPDDAFAGNNSQANAWDLVDDRPADDYGDDDFDYENFLTDGGLPFEVDSDEHSIFCRQSEGGEWYKIRAQPGEVIDIEVEYDNDNGRRGNIDVALVDESGNTLRASDRQPDADDGREIIQYGVNPGLDDEQEIYIHVRGNVLDAKVPYRLYADARAPEACSDDGFEPNNELDNPADLDPDSPHQDLEVCGDDPDFYRLDVRSNQIVTVRLESERRLGEINVALMYDDGLSQQLESVHDTRDLQEYQFATTTSEDLKLEITLEDGVGRAEYDLEWSVTDNECADDFEVNDTCPDDVEILNDGDTSGSFSVTHDDLRACPDNDYYAVNLRPLDELTVTSTYDRTEGSGGVLQMTLFGPNDCDDNPIPAHEEEISPEVFELAIGDINDPAEPFVAQEGGTYYILAVPFSGLLIHYDLDVQVQPGPACEDDTYDENGSNDAYDEAVVLQPGEVIDNGPQSALIDMKICDYNQDWYQITVADGEMLEWELRHDAADGELDATLYDDNGSNEIDTIDDQGIVSVTNDTGGDETYWLKVEGADGRPVRNSYRLLTYVDGDGTTDADCPDIFEDNDTSGEAVEITPGTESGLLSCSGDDDWYKTSVQAGETITVTTTDDADGNVDLHLYEDSDLSSYHMRSSSSSDTEELTYTSARDQFIYYRVSTASSGTPDTTYELDVATTAGPACDEDEFAGNVDSDNAQAVEAPGLYGRLMKCEDTEDWFEVDLNDGELFEAYINYDDALAGLEVAIYSANDLADLSSPTASGSTSAEVTPSADGTYYVRVHSPTRARVGYDLLLYRDLDDSGDIELDGSEGPADRVCPDQFENNDSAGEAAELTAGSYDDLFLCSGTPVNDDDYYSVYVPAGATLTADVFFSHDDGNIDLEIQGNGTTETSDSQTDDEQAVLTNSSSVGESFIVKVHGVGSFQTDYTMDLALSFAGSCTDDQFDPNENDDPASISEGAYDLTLCEDTEDWFEFTLADGEQATINMELRHRLGDIDMALYDSNGNEVASSETTDNLENIEYTNSTGSSATYELAVFPKDGVFLRNSYDLWLELGSNSPSAPFCTDPYERNDDTESSYSLDFDDDPQVADAIMCSTEADWYQVDLASGTSYDFNVFFDHSADFDLAIEVRDGNGNPIDDADGDAIEFNAHSSDNDELTTFSAPHSSGTETYFLGVKQMGGDDTVEGDYYMYFDETSASCPEDSHEPNNRSADRSSLDEGVHALGMCPNSGEGSNPEEEYFEFVPDADGTITVDVYFDDTAVEMEGYFESFSPNMTASKNRITYSQAVTANTVYVMYLAHLSGSGPYFVKVTYD